ncbi:hypothetical protein HII31_07387 [Pseudocercospora fuligena]|uniref:RRM domain-containing protein n=1 Tax=Pseudocercospora fuligena TaxID=685502 RepID=A0A8H6RGZ5_9PEZI|nr:hypothetical protein HII31_07387 [Pseudocercospora fuligena]
MAQTSVGGGGGEQEQEQYVPPTCVIASSNRENDIRPYCDILYETDGHKWGGIMPQDYPTLPTREQEEVFLRQYFSEDEIHMQGGASGEGNGFRFLKQVWWSIAIYNFQVRIPLMVDWWFKDNQDVLTDQLSHLLKPDATSSTFFQQPEIESCGKKFPDVVSKAIQWTLRHGDENHPPAISAGPVSAVSTKTEPQLAVQEPSVTTSTELPTPKSAPLPLKPTAQNFDTQSPWSANPTGQIRNFSDHTAPMPPQAYQQPQRGQSQRKRGSYNKRGSFHDPATFRPDFRNINPQAHAPGYLPPPQPFMHGAPYVPPNQVRGPSFGGPPPVQEFVPAGVPPQPMPGPYPSGNFDPSVHGMPYPPPDQTFMPGPTGYGNYPDAAYPQPYHQAQPFGERTNGQYFGRGDYEGQKTRRESVSSRAGKRSGYGTHNGRGNKSSRGRNSIGYGDARLSLRKSSNDFNAPSEDMHPRDRRSSVSNKYRQDSWRNTKQDENAMPGSGPSVEIQRPFVPQSRDLPATPASDDWLLHNCTKNQIGEKCVYVNKLIVFDVPRDMPEQVIVSFFANFGPVYSVARQGTPPTIKGYKYEKPLVYVNFAQDNKSQGARACLQPRPAPWGPLRAEVPREYWDSQHDRYSQRDAAGNEINPRHALNRFQHGRLPSTTDQSHYPSHFHLPAGSERTLATGPQPDVTTEHAGPQPLQSHKTTNGSDDASEDTTPTASGAATPNRKKGKKNKNKNKKVGLYQESLNQAFEANALKNDSLPDVARDNKVSDGGDKDAAVDSKYNDTPMQPTPTQTESPEPKNAQPETNAQGVAEALPESNEPVDSTPEAAETTVDTSTSSIPSSTTLDHEHESPSEQPDLASKDVKAEDEQGDDSFVTASGTPVEVKEEPIETVSPVEIPVSLDKPVSIPEQGFANKVVEPSAAVALTPDDSILSQKEVKKAPIPQALSKTKSQPAVVVPKPSSSKAVSEQSESVLNEAVSAEAKVTPDRPGGLALSSSKAPDLQAVTDAEPQSSQAKKVPKVKGAAETESYSIFGKKAKPKPKSKTKKPVKPVKPPQPQPENDEPPRERTPSPNGPTVVEPVNDPQPVEKSPEELKPEVTDDSEVVLPQKPGAPAPVNADASTGKGFLDKVTGKVSDFLSYASQSGSSAQESPLKQDGVEQDPDLDQPTAPAGYGHTDDPTSATKDQAVDGSELEPESSKTSKPKKNKSKKKKGKATIGPNDANPTKTEAHDAGMAPKKEPVKAEIVEMSYPASCTETKSPIYQFRGSQALTGEPDQASQAPEQSSSSPLRSPARKNQHLLTGEAKPNSRQHKRIRSGKSSDSANSSDEKALVTQKASEQEQNKNRDAVQQSLGARFPTDQESLGLGITQQSRALEWNQEMPYNVSALGKRVISDHSANDEPLISDEVKRAIEREKEMAAKEQRLKKGKPEGGKANVK